MASLVKEGGADLGVRRIGERRGDGRAGSAEGVECRRE